jgi:hypothetical protein
LLRERLCGGQGRRGPRASALNVSQGGGAVGRRPHTSKIYGGKRRVALRAAEETRAGTVGCGGRRGRHCGLGEIYLVEGMWGAQGWGKQVHASWGNLGWGRQRLASRGAPGRGRQVHASWGPLG